MSLGRRMLPLPPLKKPCYGIVELSYQTNYHRSRVTVVCEEGLTTDLEETVMCVKMA